MVTRWFRAPELLLKYNTQNYDSKIDLWSVGCILAELYLGKVLFGKKEIQKQLQLLVKLLGLPPKHLMDQIPDKNLKKFLKRADSSSQRLNFQDIIPDIEPDALDLLQRLLEYDPQCRLSAEEALKHKFFQDLHSPEDEPNC